MATRHLDFERDTLYKQVWSQPLTQVALSYGVAPNELKAAALALHVPLPPPGHWTKVEHGKGMATPPLPDFAGKTVHRVTRWVNEEAEEVAKRFAATRANLPSITPPLPEMHTAVADCLPIVKKMAAWLKKGYKDTRQWPAVSGVEGRFELGVSPGNQERALLTLDRVLRHCKSAGLEWTSDETMRDPAVFVIDGASFTLRIFESSRREEREHTPQEKAALKANPTGYHYLPNRYTYHPTNQLKLELHSTKYRTVQFAVQDSANAPLHERIEEIPAKLREAALREKLLREIRAEEQSKDDERRAAHARKVELKRKQLDRLKQFEEAAVEAERAARLRALASAMEDSGLYADEAGREKVDWIRNAADWLDPIIGKHWPVVDDVKDTYLRPY